MTTKHIAMQEGRRRVDVGAASKLLNWPGQHRGPERKPGLPPPRTLPRPRLKLQNPAGEEPRAVGAVAESGPWRAAPVLLKIQRCSPALREAPKFRAEVGDQETVLVTLRTFPIALGATLEGRCGRRLLPPSPPRPSTYSSCVPGPSPQVQGRFLVLPSNVLQRPSLLVLIQPPSVAVQLTPPVQSHWHYQILSTILAMRLERGAGPRLPVGWKRS